MINHIKSSHNIFRLNRVLPAALALVLGTGAMYAQAPPGPSPTPGTTTTTNEDGNYGGYEITSTVEIGVRGLDVNGSREKFDSDLNYKNGVRVFDSSFFVEDRGTGGVKLFDTLLLTTTGWGADPTGIFRVDMDKTGIYRFTTNFRRSKFYNNLNNHALSQHDVDTDHNFGDADLTIFPESEKFRLRFGYSYNNNEGTMGWNHRGSFGDEFPITALVDSRAHDLRAGVEGKLVGFNLSLMYGRRVFNDDTLYTLREPSIGNNPTDNGRLTTFQRQYPTSGDTDYVLFNAQRTFANRLDFTGRFVYSETRSEFKMIERATGFDTGQRSPTLPAGRIDLNDIQVTGDAKRPQARADIGLTWRATDKFRISNTFTFDRFNISGGNLYAEDLFLGPTTAGAPRGARFTDTLNHRMTGYQRFMNTIEADYQFSRRLGFNIGYRYTDRKIDLYTFERTFQQAAASIHEEEFKNKTHSVIAGMKVMPLNNWSIFWDLEHGTSDNVFTRLANADFTNFRLRSIMRFNRFTINFSAITKDNENPGRSAEVTDPNFTAVSKSRIFSGSFDWAPRDEFSISTGYTYQHIDSKVDIIVPVGAPIFPSTRRLQGVSEFYLRDSYFFFDVAARPIKRVSLFGSYRINDDKGQGDRIAMRPQDIISSYPIKFSSPEFRVAIRLTRNIDWNFGYQYFDYEEKFQTAQDYRAHLPYTSLRIYFGKGAVDR